MVDVSQPFVVDGRVATLGPSVRSRPTVFCTLALPKEPRVGRARLTAWKRRARPRLTTSARRSARLAASQWESSSTRTERRATSASSADSPTRRPGNGLRTTKPLVCTSPRCDNLWPHSCPPELTLAAGAGRNVRYWSQSTWKGRTHTGSRKFRSWTATGKAPDAGSFCSFVRNRLAILLPESSDRALRSTSLLACLWSCSLCRHSARSCARGRDPALVSSARLGSSKGCRARP